MMAFPAKNIKVITKKGGENLLPPPKRLFKNKVQEVVSTQEAKQRVRAVCDAVPVRISRAGADRFYLARNGQCVYGGSFLNTGMLSSCGEELKEVHTDTGEGILELMLGPAWLDVVVVNDGTFYCTLESSFDLKHFDMNLEEIKSIKGNPNTSPEFVEMLKSVRSQRRVVQPTGIDKKILWLSSPSILSVVEINTMKSTEIQNFWMFNGQPCLGLSVTCTPDFKRFAGLGITTDSLQTLHLYDIAGETGFSSASVKSLFQSNFISHIVAKAYAFEFSFKQTVLFLCGGDVKTGKGSLAALKFSSHPKLITEVPIIHANGNPAGVATAMVRQASGNILFVGLTSRVNLYFFDGTKFEILAEYTAVGEGTVWQMQIVDEELYCGIGGEAEFMRVLYAGRNSSLQLNRSAAKVDKSISQQFAVSTKKSVKLTEKVGWMRIGPNKELYLKVLGKLSINEKSLNASVDLAKPSQACSNILILT